MANNSPPRLKSALKKPDSAKTSKRARFGSPGHEVDDRAQKKQKTDVAEPASLGVQDLRNLKNPIDNGELGGTLKDSQVTHKPAPTAVSDSAGWNENHTMDSSAAADDPWADPVDSFVIAMVSSAAADDPWAVPTSKAERDCSEISTEAIRAEVGLRSGQNSYLRTVAFELLIKAQEPHTSKDNIDAKALRARMEAEEGGFTIGRIVAEMEESARKRRAADPNPGQTEINIIIKCATEKRVTGYRLGKALPEDVKKTLPAAWLKSTAVWILTRRKEVCVNLGEQHCPGFGLKSFGHLWAYPIKKLSYNLQPLRPYNQILSIEQLGVRANNKILDARLFPQKPISTISKAFDLQPLSPQEQTSIEDIKARAVAKIEQALANKPISTEGAKALIKVMPATRFTPSDLAAIPFGGAYVQRQQARLKAIIDKSSADFTTKTNIETKVDDKKISGGDGGTKGDKTKADAKAKENDEEANLSPEEQAALELATLRDEINKGREERLAAEAAKAAKKAAKNAGRDAKA